METYDYSKLNFNRPVNRDFIDRSLYDSKFEFVDKVNKKKKSTKLDLRTIWNDKTMFAYQYLRLDGKRLKLYDYQDLILNDSYRFKYFEASNQIGKSLSLDVDAVFEFCHDHGFGFNCAIVSKSLPQASHQMRRIKSLLNSAKFDWKLTKGDSDNMSVVSLDIKRNGKVLYTNYLIVAPSSEGLLGYDLHKLYLDEFEFWDDDVRYFYEQVAEPRTYATKGSICIFTNPNGADSYGADLTRVVLPNGDKKFHVYNFNFFDKPGNTQDDFDLASAGKNRAVIESTLLSVRTISDRNYFSMDEIEGSYDKDLNELSMVGKQPYFFLDVGAKKDQSVLVGGYVEKDEHNPKLVHLHIPIIHIYPVGYPLSGVVAGEGISNWTYQKSVKEYLAEWSADGTNPIFGVDATGNSGIVPLFTANGIHARDVVFSGPRKSGMYQRFKYYIEKGLLHRVKSPEFDYQMSHLEMKKSPAGYLKIHHASEDDHDDVPDAIAGLIYLSDSPDIVEPSMVFIGNEKPKITGDKPVNRLKQTTQDFDYSNDPDWTFYG